MEITKLSSAISNHDCELVSRPFLTGICYPSRQRTLQVLGEIPGKCVCNALTLPLLLVLACVQAGARRIHERADPMDLD